LSLAFRLLAQMLSLLLLVFFKALLSWSSINVISKLKGKVVYDLFISPLNFFSHFISPLNLKTFFLNFFYLFSS